MTALAQRPLLHRLQLGDPGQVQVIVDPSPQVTLVQWLLAAASPLPMIGPAALIRNALTADTHFALATLRGPHGGFVPDFTTPIAPGTEPTVPEQVEALRSTDPQVVITELRELWGGTVPASWRPAMDDPQRWLNSFAAACAQSWDATARLWRRHARIIERETRRVGAAVVTGSLDSLLDSLHSRLRFSDGELTFACSCEGGTELGARKLVLVPMLAGPDRVIVDFECREVAYVGYPLPGQRLRELSNGPGEREDALALVLGPLRASAIRALTKPMTMSALANVLRCAPSTATYHCDQLVAAGLVIRERRGPAIWISRSPRAAHLEDLLTFPA